LRIASALVVLLAGCSVVNDPNNHRAMPVPSDQACNVFADAVCETHALCCDVNFTTQCRSVAAGFCTSIFGNAIMFPANGYDPAAAGSFINHLRAVGARCDPEYLELISQQDGLVGVFLGTLPANAVCADQSGNYQPLVCQQPDLACVATAGSFRCAPRVALGGACRNSRDCRSELYCQTPSGTCQARLAPGAACTDAGDCQSYICHMNVCGNASNPMDVQRGICAIGI
jgi:hypothetical protein